MPNQAEKAIEHFRLASAEFEDNPDSDTLNNLIQKTMILRVVWDRESEDISS